MSETAVRAAARDGRLREELGRQQFSSQLHKALELTDDETAIYDVVANALRILQPDSAAELLLADNSHAHLELALSTTDSPRACPVMEPSQCAAVRRGQVLHFGDPNALDACPHLRKHAEACSALCAPIGVMGRSIGVLHVLGEVGAAPPEAAGQELETLTTLAGERLGLIRSLESTRLQARVDGLTGLLNRRTFEDEAHQALQRGEHVLILADLDNFKRLNDTHGHAAGDAALRLFSDLLMETVRADDLVGRFGGEEILVLLKDSDRDAAEGVLQRVRSGLAAAVERSGLPRFTSSFGVALASPGNRIDALMSRADQALYVAKDTGRDRWVYAGDPAPALVVAT